MRCPWTLVAVYWQDAFDADNGWCDVQDYKPTPCYVVSVGWLWPDALDGYITLTSSFMPDEVPDLKQVGMPTHIPVGMVRHVVSLDQPVFPET